MLFLHTYSGVQVALPVFSVFLFLLAALVGALNDLAEVGAVVLALGKVRVRAGNTLVNDIVSEYAVYARLHLAAALGTALVALILSVNLVGDWLRDAFNPALAQ